jgi:glycosyltransferase involved in cell wall biosynthesis
MRAAFIVPGPIDRMTGGSLYNRRLRDYLLGQGVEVHTLSVPDLSYAFSLIASPFISLSVAARLAGQSLDLLIIDSWAHSSLLPFILASRLSRKTRLVLIAHQLRWVEQKSNAGASLALAVERVALKSADLVITVSRFMRANIEKLGIAASKLLVAPPGSDGVREGGPLPGNRNREEQIRLLFVGNCARRKGLEYLAQALFLLKNPLVTLDVVGDFGFEPAYADQLRRDIEALDLGGAIRFHGRVSGEALRSFYSNADVFVMPSLYEGYGIVYAEAMRAGLPIIATQGGPASEIAREGENALFVPPADARSLATAIRSLAYDPGMRSRFARRSLELAQALPTWQGTCEQVHSSIESLFVGCKDRR